MSLEHQKAWSLASWLIVAALTFASIAQGFAMRFRVSGAATSAAVPRMRAGWGDWSLVICPVAILPVALVALYAQRIEARIIGFLGARSGVEAPAHLESWVTDAAPAPLGQVIGTDSVLVMVGAAMTICTLLVFASSNALTRSRQPWRWLTSYAWVVLIATCSLGALNALRLSATADWAAQILPMLPGS